MSQPFPVEIISDEEEEDDGSNHRHNQQPLPFSSSYPTLSSKKRRISEADQLANNVVVVLDDDPTPKKLNPLLPSTPSSYVPESPLSSDPFKSDFSIQKCSSKLSDPKIQPLPISSFDDDRGKKFSGGSSLICLESDNESDYGMQRKNFKENEYTAPDFGFDTLSQDFGDDAKLDECFTTDAISEVRSDNEADNVRTEEVGNAMKQKHRLVEVEKDQNNDGDQVKVKKRKTNEEKVRLAEEKKLKREQEKLQKKALKDEAAAAKKLQKEQKKLEKGKFALKSIVAEIDAKVVELGAIGGNLITRFADKGLSFRITSNPIERSILWKMSVPEHLSEVILSERLGVHQKIDIL